MIVLRCNTCKAEIEGSSKPGAETIYFLTVGLGKDRPVNRGHICKDCIADVCRYLNIAIPQEPEKHAGA